LSRPIFVAIAWILLCSGLPCLADEAAAPPASSSVSDAPKELVAQSFRMVDSSGNTTLTMNNGKDGKSPAVSLFDTKGQMRLIVTVDSGDSPMISVYNPQGKMTMLVAPTDDLAGAAINLYDGDEHRRTVIAVIKNDPVIGIYHKDGDGGPSMEMDGETSNISIFSKDNLLNMYGKPNGDVGLRLTNHDDPKGNLMLDNDGVPSLILGAGQNKPALLLVGTQPSPYVAILDGRQTRTMLTLTPSGDGRLQFYDAKGSPVVTLPSSTSTPPSHPLLPPLPH